MSTTENAAEGTLLTRGFILHLLLYVFAKAVKPASTYLIKQLDAAAFKAGGDALIFVLGKFAIAVVPWGNYAQICFYVVVILFSTRMGFENILLVDCICQAANLLCPLLMYFPFFTRLWIAQLGGLFYGISAATNNVVTSYLYVIFPPSRYSEITGKTKSAQQVGHFTGSLIALIGGVFFADESSMFLRNTLAAVQTGNQPSIETINRVAAENMNESLLGFYSIMLLITLCFVGLSSYAFSRFPRLSKEAREAARKKEGSPIAAIGNAFTVFLNLRITVMALAWIFFLAATISVKSFATSLWKEMEVATGTSRGNLNGLFDLCAYLLGAIMAYLPAILSAKLPYSVMILIQTIVCGVLGVLYFMCTLSWPDAIYYMCFHPIILCLLQYSMTFLSTIIAKSVPKTKSKVFFYILNLISFLFGTLMAQISHGLGHQPRQTAQERFMYSGMTIIISGLLLFVVLVGTPAPSGSHGHGHEAPKVALSQVSSKEIDKAESLVSADLGRRQQEA